MKRRRPHNSSRHISWLGATFFLILLFSLWQAFHNDADEVVLGSSTETKRVSLNDGHIQHSVLSKAGTVAEFLTEQRIELAPEDHIFPETSAPIFSQSAIAINRSREIIITDGTDKKTLKTYATTVQEALVENNVQLNEFDIIKPSRTNALPSDGKIAITRVTIETKIISEPIPFEKIAKEDDSLPWRTKKIQQKGEPGTRELTYEIISHNGKELTRKLLDKKITKEPITEEFIQGTYMKLGKTNTGWGTWYTQPKRMVYSYPQESGMTAASPWIAIGQYVKVTNKENGKSVVVRINDRGPFGKNRIIDLNTPAFQKIASLGAGVIDVKVEEILN